MKTGSRLAIYHPPGRIGLKSNPFGKDVANLQLYQALARHGGYGRIDLLSNLPVADADVAADLFPEGRAPCQVAGGSILSTEAATEGGVLFRGQPDLDALAWIRRKATGDRGYSLVGLIHTLAPPAMRQIIAGALTSPVQAWDAVICTSPAERDAALSYLGKAQPNELTGFSWMLLNLSEFVFLP